MGQIENDLRRKLFAIGKGLGMDINKLREVAAQYNGGYESLRKLTAHQATQMAADLQQRLNDKFRPAALSGETHGTASKRHATILHKKLRPDGRPWDYAGTGHWSQVDYMFDLTLKLGWTLWGFRGWIKKYFHTDHEKWLSRPQMMRTIEGLKSILQRKMEKNDV